MPEIAVAAPVLARDTAEEALLLSAVASLRRHDLPVNLVDGGSSPAFVDALRRLPGVSVERVAAKSETEKPGLLAQVQQALSAAAIAQTPPPDFLLYTEPDKQWFFDHRLDAFLAEATAAPDDTGVIVAARDAASFATFPAGQRLTESLLHELLSQTWGLPKDSDFTYGPLLIRPDLAAYVNTISASDLGWGWRIYLMAVCHRLGRRIHFYTADLPCPIHQRGEDAPRHRIYRMEQMAQNVRGLALGMQTIAVKK